MYKQNTTTSTTENMRVTKRNGELEEVAFDKILSRVKKLGQEVGIQINYQQLVIKIIDQLFDTISTTKIDELLAEQCASMSTINPDYGTLSGRIIVSNHQKNTDDDLLNIVTDLKNNKDIQGNLAPLVSEKYYNIVLNNKETLQNMIVYERDYLLDFFGFKTLERSYLLKVNEGKIKRIVERPQHLFIRVAVGIHGDDFESVKKT